MYRERNGILSPTWRAYALSFAAFAVLLFVAYLALFIVWREALISILAVVMNGRHWSISRLMYMLGVVAMTIVGFIFLMAAEPYLRGGVERHQLGRRFLKLFIPLAALTIIGIVVRGLL